MQRFAAAVTSWWRGGQSGNAAQAAPTSYELRRQQGLAQAVRNAVQTKVRTFGGLASQLVASIISKERWNEKLTDSAVRRTWCREFCDSDEAKRSGMTPTELGEAFELAVAVLLKSARTVETDVGNDSPDPSELSKRQLQCEFDRSLFTFACKCKCCFCRNGYEMDDDEDTAKCLCRVGEPPELRRTLVRAQRLQENTHLWTADMLRSSGMVDAEFERKIVGIFETLEAAPSADDWHPGSRGQLQDIVHPSMYCRSRVSPADDGPVSSDAAIFTWTPSVFTLRKSQSTDKMEHVTVGPGGIHNCPAGSPLEAVLTELVARCALPGFQRALNAPLFRFRDSSRKPLGSLTNLDRLEVIVKVSSLHLSAESGRGDYPSGSWHLEGVAEDSILATVIYYVPESEAEAGSLEPTPLDFRVALTGMEDYPQDGRAWLNVHYGCKTTQDIPSDDDFDEDEANEEDATSEPKKQRGPLSEAEQRLYEYAKKSGGNRAFETSCELGSLPTAPGTVLAFPNSLQHRVGTVRMKPERRGTAHRRLVVFWLVDPHAAQILPSARPAWLPGSTQLACFIRELLMIERKFVVANQSQVFERLISLCEH